MHSEFKDCLHLDTREHSDMLEIRSDIAEHHRENVYFFLLQEYRRILGEESTLLRSIDKPTAIGLLERALRTKTVMELPIAAINVAPDYYR